MSLENEIKEAFEKHGEDARPDGQSWDAVEKKVRRAHKQRVALVSTLTVVLITGAAVLVPRLTSDRVASRGFIGHTPTSQPVTSTPPVVHSANPSAAPQTAIPAGWNGRAGVQDAFALAIPPDWQGGWFEGTWDFEPLGLVNASQDGITFTVTVTVVPGTYEQNAQHPSTSVTIQGNRALVWHPSALETAYAVEWLGCPGYAPTCSSNSSTQTLIARVRGSKANLWSKYSRVGQQIIGTIHNYDGTEPVHATAGTAADSDELSKALIRFMDARAEGIGADELMSPRAADFYNANGGLYDLNGQSVVSYDVSPPTQSSASAENFGVTIHYSGASVRQELVTVSQTNPGRTGPVIANVCTGCG